MRTAIVVFLGGLSLASVTSAEPQTRAQVDSLRVERLLAAGYRAHRILAQKGRYFAVLTEQNGTFYVAPVHADSTISFLGDPLHIGDLAPQQTNWFGFDTNTISGLAVTFNAPIENIVGTALYAVSANRLTKVFTDAKGTCRPAELKDLDADGRLELISYTEDPSKTDCGDQCHVVMSQQIDMTPAWVGIHHWTGSDWQDASYHFRSFYAELGHAYEKLARWLSDSNDAAWCRGGWLAPEVVTQWIQRAKRLGG